MQKLTIIRKPNLPKAFIYYLLVCLFVCVHTVAITWRSENNLCESVLSLHSLGPGVKSKCSELGAFPHWAFSLALEATFVTSQESIQKHRLIYNILRHIEKFTISIGMWGAAHNYLIKTLLAVVSRSHKDFGVCWMDFPLNWYAFLEGGLWNLRCKPNILGSSSWNVKDLKAPLTVLWAVTVTGKTRSQIWTLFQVV